MKPYLLGIDIGTSACKVAVFEKSGTVVTAANGDYPVPYAVRSDNPVSGHPELSGYYQAIRE